MQSLFFLNAFLTLLAGNMINYTTMLMAGERADAAAFAGLAYLALHAPILVLTTTAGTTLDRFGRLHVLRAAQTGYVVAGIVLTLVAISGGESPWPIVAVAAGIGVAITFLMPGRFAALSEVAMPSALHNGTVFLSVLVYGCFGLGPWLVGWLRERHAWPVVAGTGLALYALGAVLLIPVRPRVARDVAERAAPRFVEALRWIQGERLARELLGYSVWAVFMVGPLLVIVPRFAERALHARPALATGLLALFSAGLLCGAVATRWLHGRARRGLVVVTAGTAGGVLALALGMSDTIAVSAALVTVVGALAGALGSILPAALQEITPEALRGRVMSSYTALALLTPAISGFAGGVLADIMGAAATIRWLGAFVALGAFGTGAASAHMRALR